MKKLYFLMNENMQTVAICWVVFPMLAALIPALYPVVCAAVLLVSALFGVGDYATGWWDELPEDLF